MCRVRGSGFTVNDSGLRDCVKRFLAITLEFRITGWVMGDSDYGYRV
jgi:hypothetical protein